MKKLLLLLIPLLCVSCVKKYYNDQPSWGGYGQGQYDNHGGDNRRPHGGGGYGHGGSHGGGHGGGHGGRY